MGLIMKKRDPNKKEPIIINMPDHDERRDKKGRRKLGSDMDHDKEHQKEVLTQEELHDPRRQHGKTRKDLKK